MKVKISVSLWRLLAIGLFLIAGVFFRLWLAALSPQPFIFDQVEYHRFALGILQKGLYVEPARLYGYPLLVALLYRLTGSGNIAAWQTFQALLDSFTALLVFILARRLWRQELVAWLAYLLYLFNPTTSAYTGVLLSEVTGTFLLTALLLLVVLFFQTKKPYWFWLVALFAGFLVQVRPVFLFFSVLVGLASVGWFLTGKISLKKKVWLSVIFLVLFTSSFWYTVVGNLVYFKQLSPTTVDNLPVRELYLSLYVSGRAPYHAKNGYDVYPPEVMKLYNEYSVLPQNSQERGEMAKKYWLLAQQKITADPEAFLFSRLGKFWYVWEKHYLFYYQETSNKLRDMAVYWGNATILIIGWLGMFHWGIKQWRSRDSARRLLGGMVVILPVYVSLIHSVSLAEERYSLPAYPLIFVFASYTLVRLLRKLKIRTKS